MASIAREETSYTKRNLQNIKNFTKVLGYPLYNEVIIHINSLISRSEMGIVRRLSVLSDYEGKPRVIAIGDYLSNVVLKPLHNELMTCLSGLKADKTHKQ